jgi:signal transduction histidine kinase
VIQSTSLDPDDILTPRALTSAEIHASRARILEAADEARRRLERDLHDGAQQRLVLAALTLKQAQAEARGTLAEQLVADAFELVQQGLTELRDLARGIHPAVLRERGLAAALQGLVAASPVPVELRVLERRVARAAEATIYFTIAEALTNVSKHSHAALVSVQVVVEGGEIIARVADDGIGGVRVTAGSGLLGLYDRLDAIGGTLTVESPPGEGTTICARIPLRSHDQPAGRTPGAHAHRGRPSLEPWSCTGAR